MIKILYFIIIVGFILIKLLDRREKKIIRKERRKRNIELMTSKIKKY